MARNKSLMFRNDNTKFHFIYGAWMYCYNWGWSPSVIDNFGNLVRINTTRTTYSLWGLGGPYQ